jgi:hypothetical protein
MAAVALAQAGGSAEPAGSPLARDRRAPVGIAIESEDDGLFEALRAADARAAIVLGEASGQPPEALAEARSGVATLTAVADPADGPVDRTLALAGESSLGPAEPSAFHGPGHTPSCMRSPRTAAVAERARTGAAGARPSRSEASYDDH